MHWVEKRKFWIDVGVVDMICLFNTGCRLRLLAESKGYRLDDTGLFLATQSSGGKRVNVIFFLGVPKFIYLFIVICDSCMLSISHLYSKVQKLARVWVLRRKRKCLISWVFLGLNLVRGICKWTWIYCMHVYVHACEVAKLFDLYCYKKKPLVLLLTFGPLILKLHPALQFLEIHQFIHIINPHMILLIKLQTSTH